METGMVFDIREFAIHDGPGIRTTVFMKGCPLRCCWCHNPEGISQEPQTIHSAAGERCVGTLYTSEALSRLLNGQADILRASGGGITFSGGEPLQQAPFIAEVIQQLDNQHVVLDTSGYGSEACFRLLAELSDLIYFDIKLVDPQRHKQFTRVDNELILRNFRQLADITTPVVVRVPLIPGVTDTDENLTAIADLACNLPHPPHVNLLPYNRAAGGKYAAAGMQFAPPYDESQANNLNISIFTERHVEVQVV
ncbi:MAG TPA: radical SAM protein [Armatimonadota bacterium]|nr:radical SAM protein [Armatimonadota bacterium]